MSNTPAPQSAFDRLIGDENDPRNQPTLIGRTLVIKDKWTNRTRYVRINGAVVNGDFTQGKITLDIFETPRTGASPLILGVKVVRKANGDFVSSGTFVCEFLKFDTYSLVPVKKESNNVTATRTATVKAEHVGWGGDPLATVQQYLPRGYTANQEGDTIVITGTDDAGWTLDGYVLPRLASGNIFATEVN